MVRWPRGVIVFLLKKFLKETFLQESLVSFTYFFMRKLKKLNILGHFWIVRERPAQSIKFLPPTLRNKITNYKMQIKELKHPNHVARRRQTIVYLRKSWVGYLKTVLMLSFAKIILHSIVIFLKKESLKSLESLFCPNFLI